eukprot:Selendium_serpulae@DN6521_c3_g1_i2.p2
MKRRSSSTTSPRTSANGSPLARPSRSGKAARGAWPMFQMYRREVDLLRELQGKANIVELMDSEIEEDIQVIKIVMEKGEMDFNMLAQRQQRFCLSEIHFWFGQMVRAVRSVHQSRVVHGDLKPGNFIVKQDGELKLIDFGIADMINDDTTHIWRDKVIGSLYFMSPESVCQPNRANAVDGSKTTSVGRDQKLSRAADIWALGAMLYRLIYRRHVFQKASGQVHAPHEVIVWLS